MARHGWATLIIQEGGEPRSEDGGKRLASECKSPSSESSGAETRAGWLSSRESRKEGPLRYKGRIDGTYSTARRRCRTYDCPSVSCA